MVKIIVNSNSVLQQSCSSFQLHFITVTCKCRVSSSAKDILGSITKSITIWFILPLHQALVRPHVERWIQFCMPQYKEDMDLVEQVQHRAKKMMYWSTFHMRRG